jgi:hypothetical protein
MKAAPLEDERREFKRFLVKDGFSFVSHSNWPDKGMLVDISKGGFAFHYNAKNPWPEYSDEGCTIFGAHDSCLNNIPVTVVADQVIPCGQGNSIFARRRSIKFDALNQHQKFLLECFIWINSTVQC